MQLIDATEVMLRGGHKGTKTQSTIACRLAFSSIPHVAPEFPPSIHRGSRPGWRLRGKSWYLTSRTVRFTLSYTSLRLRPLNFNGSIASKSAWICSRLNRSDAWILMVKSQHRRSPLQAHLA